MIDPNSLPRIQLGVPPSSTPEVKDPSLFKKYYTPSTGSAYSPGVVAKADSHYQVVK